MKIQILMIHNFLKLVNRGNDMIVVLVTLQVVLQPSSKH
jgi:hypothetical protein